MLTYFDAAIGGEWMSSLDENLLVIDVQESKKKSISTADKPFADGQRFIRSQRKTLSVAVRFVIAHADPSRRAYVLGLVQEWAHKGERLEVNYRENQFLLARCDDPPSLTSANVWTGEMTVVFTAYEFPFWLGHDEAAVTISGSGSISPGGTYDRIPCDVRITNKGSAPVTAVTVSANQTSMSFEGISLPPGAALEITHSEQGILSAKIGEASVLARRTDTSSDDLLVSGGTNNSISVAANGSVTAAFKARGVYL